MLVAASVISIPYHHVLQKRIFSGLNFPPTKKQIGTSSCSLFSRDFMDAFLSDSDLLVPSAGKYQNQATDNHKKSKTLNKNAKKKNDAMDKYDKIILKSSRRHNIDPALVKAVIIAESAMNPHAVSKKGARGLMQLMPETAKSMGLKNRTNPRQNIEAGTKYLKYLIDEYDGNIRIALAAYNAGPGAVKRYKGIPPYKRTRQYIQKVLAYYDEYTFENDT